MHDITLFLSWLISGSSIFFFQEQQEGKATQFPLSPIKYRKDWTEGARNSPLVPGQEVILNGRGADTTSDEKLQVRSMSEQLTSTCDKLVKPQDFLLRYDVTVIQRQEQKTRRNQDWRSNTSAIITVPGLWSLAPEQDESESELCLQRRGWFEAGAATCPCLKAGFCFPRASAWVCPWGAIKRLWWREQIGKCTTPIKVAVWGVDGKMCQAGEMPIYSSLIHPLKGLWMWGKGKGGGRQEESTPQDSGKAGKWKKFKGRIEKRLSVFK